MWITLGNEKDVKAQLEKLWLDLGGSEGEGTEFKLEEAFGLLDESLTDVELECLIILDDMWLDEHFRLFAILVQQHPSIRLLITTRFKGKVTESFGRKSCQVVSLMPKLVEQEALALMRVYADWNGTVEDDITSMLQIAKVFEFHPKALSIISTQAAEQDTWASLAVFVTENVKEAKDEAADYVFNAADAVFQFQSKVELKEQFYILGVFREDKHRVIKGCFL